MTDIISPEISFDIPFGLPGFRYAEGKPLFTAYGCVLFEKETPKSYTYRAYPIKGHQSALISRRTKEMEESDYNKIIAKIRELPFAGAGRFEADRASTQTLSRNQVCEILEHVFHELLPSHGYAIRKPQAELAAHIMECLCGRHVTLAEAEVGIGKTLAYLTAAALIKRGRINDFWFRGNFPGQSYAASAHLPVVVSTSSIALQNAIVRDYIPELSRILMDGGVIRTPLTCVLRKGREHYLCERRLRGFLSDADQAAQALLAPLLDRASSIDLADADLLTPYMKRKIGVTGRCAHHCPHRESCRYLSHMDRVRSSEHDFQICNHNYLLADILHRRGGGIPLIPHHQAVIIDEGHKFLAAARQMYGVELTASDIPPVTEDIHSFDFRQGDSGSKIWRSAKKLCGQSRRLFKELAANIPLMELEDDETERFTAVLDEDTTRHLRNIGRISADLREHLSEQHVQTRHKGRCAHVLWELTGIQGRAEMLKRHSNLVCWLEKQGEELSLCAIPQNLDELLYQDFWSKGIPIVLTSGTLSAAGDFSRIKQALGLHRLQPSRLMECTKPSPFDYYSNTLMYISERIPFPDNRNRDYLADIADEVERLALASHGHAAVLFTSYKAMDIVREILEERHLPFPLFQLNRGGGNVINRFKESKGGVLFASGALWEGIDIPGDALSLLIIVKLPFAAPDPVSEYERTLYADMDAYKSNVIVPDMLVKLKQGFGRLIRTETDSGAVALLDCRARIGAAYHDKVIAALPFCRVVTQIGEVEHFMREKKALSFFI